MMTEAFKTLGESAHDARIIPIKEYWTEDGSCETLGLYVSFKESWSNRAEFLSALKLLHVSKTINVQKREHFEKLLEWFNDYSPGEIKIVPRYESLKEVIFDDWNFKTIMWEEDGRYYLFSWETSA